MEIKWSWDELSSSKREKKKKKEMKFWMDEDVTGRLLEMLVVPEKEKDL